MTLAWIPVHVVVGAVEYESEGERVQTERMSAHLLALAALELQALEQAIQGKKSHDHEPQRSKGLDCRVPVFEEDVNFLDTYIQVR